MLFNSLGFLYFFLPVTYLGYRKLTTARQRYLWLTLTGYVFYGMWNWRFCFLMLFSTCVSYSAALAIERHEAEPRKRKVFLTLAVATDLTLLAFFKYFNFLLGSMASALKLAHADVHVPHLDIVLPIGISFYTFHTISYIADVYRRKVRPTRNFFEFSCYVSLFSQLVAGPIVRFGEIEQDLERISDCRETRNPALAWSYFSIGIIKKVLIADMIALAVNPALAHYRELSTLDAWLVMLGYTYQLYFDFSGYSDMAVGLGHLFNIRIPQNFNSPYKAVSVSDFWRRWHMSLSSCLRDYLYIALGGNRKGTFKTYRNLMLTMAFGGLWHGANWTFVVWGVYHGLWLCLERLFPWLLETPAAFRRVQTFFIALIGWVFFRADDIPMAMDLLGRMFRPTAGAAIPGEAGLVALVVLAAGIAHFAPNSWEMRHEWKPVPAGAIAALFLVSILVITSGNPSPFLYFQF